MSELLAIGQQCSHPACSLVDFLPIKCQHCTKPFCSDHFKPDVHSCEKFDPTKHDRIAPACPFCQKPVAFAAGVDPNIAMENHFETSCAVVAGGGLVGMRSKAGGGSGTGASPRCARAKCNKVLITPIRCPACSQQFCAEHRFPVNHKCVTGPTGASASNSSSSSASPTPAPVATASTSFADSAAARKNAALAAMNRAKASVVAAAKPASSPAKSSSAPIATLSSSAKPTASSSPSNSNKNPFGKTERRSRAEEESRKRAFRERAKKGLLSGSEKAQLAAMEAEGKKGKDGDCLIM
ncbi:hypothetical protein M407DRAFT_241041 [Tulasnella calospora MUT 4182]|uniref:AN1-type domain-containing protein n=1 Tax=Tulasnella calospora MUT 4182 TaxID=1051891 RepID=A0A0C3LHI7_9AGAM|nr:hypothetical protein M407DRAFT_241041 [Tulasnella calospora MUT 4182]